MLSGTLDDTSSVFGKYSYKIDLDRNTEVPMIRLPVSIGKEYTFSFYAKSNQKSVKGEIFIGNDPWAHFVQKPIVLTNEWNRYSIKIKTKKDKYELGFRINESSVFLIDAVQFEEGELTDYHNNGKLNFGIDIPSEVNKVFFKGEPVSVNILINNSSPVIPEGKYCLSYSIADYYGNKLADESLMIDLDKNGNFKKSLILNPMSLR